MLKNRSTIALAIAALSLNLLASCNGDKKDADQQDTTASEATAVVTVPVEHGMLSSSIAIPGELLPYQQVDLYAKINSYVKKMFVDIGSEVHQGQLLVALEAPEINSQLAGAQSRIKQQEAIYYASKAMYDRLVNTSKTPGTISQNDIEQAEAKKNADMANVEAAKSAYKEISSNLSYLEIRAPFDGVITNRNVNLGAYVGPGGKNAEPLLVLQDQTRLRLVVSVPEAYTNALNHKSSVSFTIRELPGQNFNAKISRIAGALDEKLRSERLEMDVYNTSKKLMPHMYADVIVPLPSNDSTYIVPKTAVVTSTEKVFVVKIVNHKAEWVEVQKGMQSDDKMEVFGKLKAGDKVAKTATDELRDGQPVTDTEDKGEDKKEKE